jgi:hypothetical protein
LNVHRFALSAITGELLRKKEIDTVRERESEREKERKRERKRERESNK